jgi:hypothetical protein
MPDEKLKSAAAIVFVGALVLLFIAAPAGAAEPVYPIGSRIGLVPPAGMVASDRFDGFTDPNEQDAAILIAALPQAAYAQIEKSLDAEAAKKQGVHLDKRESITLDAGKGLLLSGWQMADGARFRKWLLLASASDLTVLITVQAPEQNSAYNDQVVRAALATLTIREKVPESEELSLLPFAVGDLAGFHIDGALRGRALILSDAPAAGANGTEKEDAASNAYPHFLIAAVPGGPSDPADRGNFARLSFDEIGGIKNVRLTMSEPLRVGGQSGYQTMADAQDARSGADIKVVQWLRFGTGGYLQMIGIGPAESWGAVLARLRTVRDSIEPK